jgi:hypothetical protein
MFLHAVVLLLALTTPDEPWRIEITTSGGFAGHGAGGAVVTAGGALQMQRDCELRLSADDVKSLAELVTKAKPQDWKPSYANPANPNGCCDMIQTTLTLTRSGKKWTSSWYNDHLPLPADLEAILAAVWSSETKSVAERYRPQCKP